MLFACCCLLQHWLSIPSRCFLCAGQGSAQRQMHGSLAGEREMGERVKKTEREKVSELSGLGQKRNRKDGAICSGSSRTLGGLLKEMGQCVKGEWKIEGGGVEEGGLALLWVSKLSFFKAIQWSQSGFVC